MGQVINLGEERRKRAFDRVVGQIGGMYQQAESIINEYIEEVLQDPRKAFNKLPKYLERVDGTNNPMLGCDPNFDWSVPMFNMVGAVYPELEKEGRELGLRKILNYLDGINNVRVQPFIERMHEPWLVGDILVSRWIYWPGCKVDARKIEKASEWSELESDFNSTLSQFFFAFSVIAVDWTGSTLGVRQSFYEKEPDLTDRTLDTIAAMTYLGAFDDIERKNIPLEVGIEKRIKTYDTYFHDEIRNKMKEEKWIRVP
jgi:hypothetical protein